MRERKTSIRHNCLIEYEVFSARIFKKCVADRAENLDLVLENERVDIMQKKLRFRELLLTEIDELQNHKI